MNYYALIWFGAMLLFLILEASTVGVVSIWFAAGSLCAMIASICGAQLWLQIALFGVVSLALLAALRPLTKKCLKPKLVKTNVDAVIGSIGRVIEPIDNDLSQGRVKIANLEWSARSSSGEPIDTNTMIQVDRIEGVKVYVSKAQVKTNV